MLSTRADVRVLLEYSSADVSAKACAERFSPEHFRQITTSCITYTNTHHTYTTRLDPTFSSIDFGRAAMSAEWDAEYARQLQMEEVERVRRLQNRSGGTQQGSSRDVEHGSADAFGGMLSQGDEEYSVGIEDFGSQGSVHDVGGAAGGSGRGMAAEHLHGGLEPFELFMYRHGLTAGGQLPGTEFRRLQSAKRAPIRENWREFRWRTVLRLLEELTAVRST